MVGIITCDIDQFVIKRLITKWYKFLSVNYDVTLYLRRESFFPKEVYNMVYLIELKIYMSYQVSYKVINFRKLESITLDRCKKTHINLLKLPKLNEILIFDSYSYKKITKSPTFANDLMYLVNMYL